MVVGHDRGDRLVVVVLGHGVGVGADARHDRVLPFSHLRSSTCRPIRTVAKPPVIRTQLWFSMISKTLSVMRRQSLHDHGKLRPGAGFPGTHAGTRSARQDELSTKKPKHSSFGRSRRMRTRNTPLRSASIYVPPREPPNPAPHPDQATPHVPPLMIAEYPFVPTVIGESAIHRGRVDE